MVIDMNLERSLLLCMRVWKGGDGGGGDGRRDALVALLGAVVGSLRQAHQPHHTCHHTTSLVTHTTRMTQSIPDSTRAMRGGSFKPAEEDHFIYDPEDVAPVVAWLCTDSAGHINGEIVHAVGNRISLFNKYETRLLYNYYGFTS